MPNRKKAKITPEAELLLLTKKSIHPPPNSSQTTTKEQIPLLPLSDRIKQLLNLLKFPNNKTTTMYLILYDIEKDKIRTRIAKYLIKKGCIRIQKSVYIINTSPTTIQQISNTLHQIQQAYQNNDSIIIMPISKDILKITQFIGKEIYLNYLSEPNITLFL